MINQFDQYKEQILKTNPLSQTMVYDYDKWIKWLKDSLGTELCVLNKEFKGSISRKNLIDYAEKVNKDKSEEQCTQLFLACMMWGYGGDSSKNIDHRGPYRVKKIFNSSDEVKKAIHEAFCCISKNDIENAFQELLTVKGLSISFLSKFLYFASRGCKVEEYALIFDVRVAKSIVKFNSIQKDLIDIVIVTPSISYDKFKKYLNFVHELAKRYKCEAENIELFLFEQAG